jgi:hypothetical protein
MNSCYEKSGWPCARWLGNTPEPLNMNLQDNISSQEQKRLDIPAITRKLQKRLFLIRFSN